MCVIVNWPMFIVADLYTLILRAFRVWDPVNTVSNSVIWPYDVRRLKAIIFGLQPYTGALNASTQRVCNSITQASTRYMLLFRKKG